MSPLEIVAVIVSATGVWLTTRRSLLSWPVTLLACALYAAVFAQAKFYSDMLLQGVFASFAVYGWVYWLRGVRAEGTVRVLRIAGLSVVRGIGAGVAGSAALGYLMARYTDAAIPHVDSALTAFSLVAQWWSTRKYMENWLLWIAIDSVYTVVFVVKHLYLTAGLYAFFVVLAIQGLRAWKLALRGTADSDSAACAAVESESSAA
jgi:nicotinamide mononucleotide transporter